MSVDGWAEQLLKLDYEKEKHFKESVIIIDSLQNMASGQTNMVGSADRGSVEPKCGRRLIHHLTDHRGSVRMLHALA